MSGAQHAPAQQLLLEEPLELLQSCALPTELAFVRLQLSGSPPPSLQQHTGKGCGIGAALGQPPLPSLGQSEFDSRGF